MKKSYLYLLFLTIALLFSVAIGILYLKKVHNQYIPSTIELVDKRKLLIKSLKSGAIEVSKENFLGFVESSQRADISLIKTSKTSNEIYSSLAFLLASIGFLQMFLVYYLVKNP